MTLKNHNKNRGKGNKEINKELAKPIRNGEIVQRVPEIDWNGRKVPLFTYIPPNQCINCGSTLGVHQYYSRHIISSYGIIEVPVQYLICKNPVCREYQHGSIIGVTGSANYSDEYLEKQETSRLDGKGSFWNTRGIGEIYTQGLTDENGRAACPTTLWKYEQHHGEVALEILRRRMVPYNGTLYIDGYWVKKGGRKALEDFLGLKLSKSSWKRVRYVALYVVSTEEKVIVDFEITPSRPKADDLKPLLKRLKKRFKTNPITRMVSDEERAIIDAIQNVFPGVEHSYCTFHQLKTIQKLFHDEYPPLEKLSKVDQEVYGLAHQLILARNAIASTIYLRKIEEKIKESNCPNASAKLLKCVKKYYHKNRQCFQRFFHPVTNNVMEQLFSFFNDFVFQCRSFKTVSGMKNFFSSLFELFNHRAFNTGQWRGYSPIERAQTCNS